MKIIFYFLLFAGFINLYGLKYTINGYIRDAQTGEELIGASVADYQNHTGTISNSYGFFSFTLDSGLYIISFSYLGYSKTDRIISLNKNVRLDIELLPLMENIQEVKIISKSEYTSVADQKLFLTKINTKKIKEIPVIFGENDVIKALQQENGVITLGEGSSGLYVYGGNLDQNLILIDEAPVYNPSHLYGLISVFNPDAVKDVEFYKGSLPAKYGGRLSSVVNCKMNEGNIKKIGGTVGIGNLSCHAAIEGPVKRDTASFLIALRRSFIDLFRAPDNNTLFVPEFYDVNTKVNWRINDKNRLFYSFYYGQDKIDSYLNFTNKWSNITSTLRWNHTFNTKLFSNISVIFSNYENNWEFNNTNKYYWNTGVKDFLVKSNFAWYINPFNTINLGSESVFHHYTPGENQYQDQSIPSVNALENVFYLQHEMDVIQWLTLNFGVRFSLFQNIGEGSWYKYENNFSPLYLETNHKGVYNSNFGIEPRLLLSINPGVNHSLKISYTKNYQYAQVLHNSIFAFTSIQPWLPVNPNIKPLYADIFSVGYYINLTRNILFITEAYYKKINNIIDYIDHAQLIGYTYIESQLRIGNCMANGVMAGIKITNNKFSCNLDYTLSKVTYIIHGINYGEKYNALYDIPHNFNFLTGYKLNKNISFHADWKIHSGFVATFPVSYIYGGIPIYGERNSGRMPVYHRLDISGLFEKQTAKKSIHSLQAGVYNVYGKFNPAGYIPNGIEPDKLLMYSFFRVIPGFNYSYKF